MLSSLIIFNSCTESIDGVIELPYSEQLVIRGVLVAGKPVIDISINKTQPALEAFDINKAMISNADAKIISENKEYPLIHVGLGMYKASDLIAEIGKTYRLEVRWNGKFAYANTSIPAPVSIESVKAFAPFKQRRSNLWTVGLNGFAKVPSNTACVSGFEYIDSLGLKESIKTYANRVYREQDTGKIGKTNMTLFSIEVADTNKIFYDSASYKLNLFVESYDMQFYQYFRTRLNGDSPNSTFGFSGGNIQWNVNGDGVGLFIGYSTYKMRYIK